MPTLYVVEPMRLVNEPASRECAAVEMVAAVVLSVFSTVIGLTVPLCFDIIVLDSCSDWCNSIAVTCALLSSFFGWLRFVSIRRVTICHDASAPAQPSSLCGQAQRRLGNTIDCR